MKGREEGEKPTPVRASSPLQGGPAPSPPGEDEDASADTATGGEDRRPTPVRAAMEGGEVGVQDQPGSQRRFDDPDGGEEWIVTVTGRSASGVLPLRTVPILELGFALAAEPNVHLRRALCPGDGLEGLSEERLLSTFRGSGPFRPSLVVKGADEKRRRRGRGGRGPKG